MIKYYFFIPVLFIMNMVFGQDKPKTVLWEVTKDGNSHKSYLFGTFHEVDPTFFEGLINSMNKLKQSDLLFVEQKQNISNTNDSINPANWTMDKWKSLLTNRQDSIFSAFTTKAENTNYYYVPPLLLNILTARLYFQSFCDREERTSFDLMDNYIENLAGEENKNVFSLDENQGVMFKNVQSILTHSQDSLYASGVVYYMEMMLNEDQSGCAIITDYKTFQLNYELDTDVRQGKELDALLTERNKKWLPIIEQAFSQKNCFVAVGFRHLFYKQGLIQLLRAAGYIVSPVAAK